MACRSPLSAMLQLVSAIVSYPLACFIYWMIDWLRRPPSVGIDRHAPFIRPPRLTRSIDFDPAPSVRCRLPLQTQPTRTHEQALHFNHVQARTQDARRKARRAAAG